MDPPPDIAPANPSQQNDTDSGPFLCKICSKSFTKRPSRNRHVLYCRKKFGDNLPVLRKSCAVCRKAKVKCNSEFPRCRRCIDKDLVCAYELARRGENLAQQLASPPLSEPRSNGTTLVETSRLGSQKEISWESYSSYNNQTLLNPNVDHSRAVAVVPDLLCQHTSFEWEPDAGCGEEIEAFDAVANSYSNGLGNDFPLDWFSSGPLPSLTFESAFSTPADCMFHTPYLVLRPMDYEYASQSTSLVSPRSPFIHSRLSTGSQIGRTFLIQSMQSYATLLATSTLPLFIHSVSLPTQGPSLPSSAPLEICKSIISLYTRKTAATNQFIWRAITMEKDRFMEEFEDVDEWTRLSMLQAITLYILLRIFDQDSFSVDFDRELVRAMTKIAIKAEQRQHLCQAEVEGWRPDWKEWVLLESKRRTVTLLFILHLLFDIKPEQKAKSHVGLSVLPLPAHKQLWRAGGEEEWRREYDEMLRAREGRSYLRYEDLMDLGKGKVTGGRMKDLNAWMVSSDGFGMLVMMAATTLGCEDWLLANRR